MVDIQQYIFYIITQLFWNHIKSKFIKTFSWIHTRINAAYVDQINIFILCHIKAVTVEVVRQVEVRISIGDNT